MRKVVEHIKHLILRHFAHARCVLEFLHQRVNHTQDVGTGLEGPYHLDGFTHKCVDDQDVILALDGINVCLLVDLQAQVLHAEGQARDAANFTHHVLHVDRLLPLNRIGQLVDDVSRYVLLHRQQPVGFDRWDVVEVVPRKQEHKLVKDAIN